MQHEFMLIHADTDALDSVKYLVDRPLLDCFEVTTNISQSTRTHSV